MKKFFSILFLIPLLSFSQYPSWFPNEFKNKILCGSKYNYDTRGNDSYKLYVSEDGFQLTINGKKSIKINYKTIKISENKLWKNFRFDLRSSNETKDSPYDPKIKLHHLSIEVPTDFYYSLKKRKNNLTRDEHREYYKTIEWAEKRGSLESHFYFKADIIGKYFTTNIFEEVYKRDICGNLKTKAEILKEENEKKRILKQQKLQSIKIREFINNNKISEAAEYYSNSSITDEISKSEIQKVLDDYYADKTGKYDIRYLGKFINANKDYLNTLNDGNYTFKFKNNGLQVGNATDELKLTQISDIPYQSVFDFKVYLKFEINVDIKTNNPSLIETKYYSNVNKPIFINKNDSFFFKTKSGLPQISSSEFVFDENIPKNTIKISKTYMVKKYANELLISDEKINKINSATIFKKE